MDVSKASVSRTLSTRLAAPDDLDAFSRGLTDSYVPKNSQDYWSYRRYMHDILCLAFLDAGIYSKETFTLSEINISVNDPVLNKQKPDLFTLEMDNLEIGEITLTFNAEHDKRRKHETYKKLLDFIAENTRLSVNFNVFVVDLSDSEWEDSLPALPGLHMTMLRSFVENLRLIHSTGKFASYRSDTSEFYSLDKFRFELDPKDITEFVGKITDSKPSFEEIIARIETEGPERLDQDTYLNMLADGILKSPLAKRPHPHPEPTDAQDLIDSWQKYKSSPKTTTKLPRILQLGAPMDYVETYVEFSQIISDLKSTSRHGGYLDLVKSFLASSDPDKDHTIVLSLSEAQLHSEQMQGPGRKSALKRMGLKPKRDPPKHISIDTSHVDALDDLIESLTSGCISNVQQELSMPDFGTMGASMYTTVEQAIDMHMENPFSAVAKFYQRLSTEIVINSMRRRKNRQYVLCDSGFKGIYCLIAPGPQLRTESNTEFVKIISLVRPLVHELSAPWLPVGDHWESEWLSVDTDRLKHWARSFDRTLISSVTCAERLVEKGKSLLSCCKEEIKHGNFALMVLTYLEDKQLTSLTNQTIRYLWMKALGDKQFGSIMSKFPTRVGSVIQSTMMQRAVETTLQLCKSNIADYIRVPQSRMDQQTGAYDETTTGVLGKLPRLITKGQMVPISYNLNEIYWCMMYNKDRQNPAQDSLSILNKILKEESLFDKEIGSRKTESQRLSYLFGNSTLQEDLDHVNAIKPESHFFSRRAVQIGLSLQTKHKENVAPDYSWRTYSKLNAILGKNLSEFATFKASVKTICHKVDVSDLTELDKIGSRTKAVELVAELVSNEKLTQAFEVAMSFSGQGSRDFDIMIQIFKKGQIGGIREIMILFIKARILFNLVEEVCRLLAKSDKREILTKGKDKRLMMRGDYEEVMSQFAPGTPVQVVKNSYDMSTWCQKFIPTIFCSIYTQMFDDLPAYKNLAYFVFLKHTNKQIEYPRKLTEMWVKHPSEKHEERWLQDAKEKFLSDGVPFFRNHSNMCQGIPHYNSTVLALSCQSLRDELFMRCLKILGQEKKIVWKTRVGSDDKGDMIGIDMTSKDAYKQYLLFEQCAHASERLHSMELSVKSAAGNILYELNSAFMANLETLSPTIKFSLAACDMMQTASCTNFVNESYGRIRQLRENGASSVLCGIGHILNRNHFFTMFRTGRLMTNDVQEIFKVPEENIPYDFGVYPFYDVDMQDIVGPEFHNYLCMISDNTPRELKQLLFTPLSKDDLDEAFPSEDEGLLKKDHFGIRQGLIKQLVGMRRRLGIEALEVDQFFKENPFLIVRGPETIEETIKVIHSKLLTKGASEALRRTSPAIYLGRLSAFESAKAWKMLKPTGTHAVDLESGTVSELEEPIHCTYKEFLTWGLEKAKRANFPVEKMMNVIFPQKNSYEIVRQFVGQFGPRRENKKLYSQAVRGWVVNNFNYNFSNTLKSILETSFGMSQLSSREDVNEFRNLLGFRLESYEGFLKECQERHIRPMDLFFYMSKIYKASKSSKIQAFASGPSTSTLQNTILSIKRFSHLPNHEMVIDSGIDELSIQSEAKPEHSVETMKFCCNLFMMEDQESLSGPESVSTAVTIGSSTLAEWVCSVIRRTQNIQGFDHHTKKVFIYLACKCLPKEEIKEKMLSWRTLNYTYLKRQVKSVDSRGRITWSGDLKMLVNSGYNTYTLNIVDSNHYIRMMRVEDPESLYSSLKEMCRMLEIDAREFFTRRPVTPNTYYLSANSKSLVHSPSSGPEQNCLNLICSKQFSFLRLQDLDNFKVSINVDKKAGSISVCLEQKEDRTATLAHFPGSYYPASCPNNATILDEIWFRGLRLSRILQNKDWFYNYRLPSLTDSESTRFFQEDVNFDIVLEQSTYDKGKVVEYLQVMNEINEEAFNINNTTMPMSGTVVEPHDYTFDPNVNVEDLFREEMLNLKSEGIFTVEPIDPMNKLSWADMVEEEEEDNNFGVKSIGDDDDDDEDREEMFEALGGKEDGIRFIRSLGYKKQARKANFLMISQLQHGHLIKERVLNMFFKNASITSESRRALPHYYVWLENRKDQGNKRLIEELQRVILGELQVAMSFSRAEIIEALGKVDRRKENAPIRVLNYFYGEQIDLFQQVTELITGPESEYEESTGDQY